MYKYNLIVNEVELQIEKYKNENISKVMYHIFISNKYLFPYHAIDSKLMSSDKKLEIYLENFISEKNLVERIEIDNDLPVLLKNSIVYCIQEEKMNEVVAVFLLNYEEFKRRVKEMFEEASKVLNMSINEVIMNTDYNYIDQKANRLNNAFAEVRAVISLKKLGFNNIELLSSKESMKCVDIVAYKDNKKYVIDVAHFTDSFDKDYNERFSDNGVFSAVESFKYNIERVYIDKKEQLLTSQNYEKSDKKALFILIDEINGYYAVNTYEKLEEDFRLIHSNLEFKDECDLILIFNGTTYYFN